MAGYAPAPEMRAMSELPKAIEKLTGRDREFATSLLNSAKEYGKLSEKQMIWVDKLIAKASAEQTQAAAGVAIGELEPILAMFTKAKGKLQYPKILITCGEATLKLTVAGPNTKVPGSINVATPGAFGENVWYGRITLDGQFHGARAATELPELQATLTAFAKDPAGVSAAYGHATHHCCYCAKELTDERSTSVGYGPICADHYGLPWGEKPATTEGE